MNDKYLTVTELTRYIKYKIDNDQNLIEVFLKGEISNFKAHSRGHFYFTLKDENSRINAIMFATNTKKIKFMPSEGMKVLVTGKISVYEATGAYQIYVNDMLEDGVGNLYIAFEQLKEKLQKEGLFNQDKKIPIPKFPKSIGIITAPTGAAIRDILSTIKRRWPLVDTYLFPALVQGETAYKSVSEAIKKADSYNLDVLIIGRGGGSIEDLWAFNEEEVARTISNAKTPIISAVGHEVDFTISDFVADLRAPTPTGAAEMAVPDIKDVTNYLKQLQIRLIKVVKNNIDLKRVKLNEIKNKYILTNPLNLYQSKEQKLDLLIERLKANTNNILLIKRSEFTNLKTSYILTNPSKIIEKKKQILQNLIAKLEPLSPLLTLKRGYAITSFNNKIITNVNDIKQNDIIDIKLSVGKITAQVKEIKK